MEIDYRTTNRQFPVNVNELIKSVNSQLAEFDHLTRATGQEPDYNPYQRPVFHTTQEGRLVQVPYEIQQRAIHAWQQSKITGQYQTIRCPSAINQEIPDTAPAPIETTTPLPVVRTSPPQPVLPEVAPDMNIPEVEEGPIVTYVFENSHSKWILVGLFFILLLCIYMWNQSRENPFF